MMSPSDGRVGNMLSTYSSLMVNSLCVNRKHKLILYLQYFKLKYGFHPTMSGSQLKKLYPIFKEEKFSVFETDVMTPDYLDIHWEIVGPRMMMMTRELYRTILGFENKSAGRDFGVFEPNAEFLNNIQNYQHDRFLNIGTLSQLLS